jgi:hypothetical protein
METTTRTTVISRMIQEEQIDLVLTLTPDDVEALLAIGRTSHYDRINFLTRRPDSDEAQANNCSNLLSAMYFAAVRYKKENYL